MANSATEKSDQAAGGRVIMWMIPRSISTAFTKCMSGIPGCEVWMEPFGTCFNAANVMTKAGIGEIPMTYEGHEKEFQLAAEELEKLYLCKISPLNLLAYATVNKDLEESTSKYVFSKDESLAMETDERRRYIPKGFRHTFLIRHPYLVYKSMRKAFYKQFSQSDLLKQNEDENSFDLRLYAKEFGFDDVFKRHHDNWTYIRENIDPSPMVIDSSVLLKNPATVLSKYCEAMGFPYSDSLLKWDGSPEVGKSWRWAVIDGYKNEAFIGVAIYSTHFTAPADVPIFDELTEDVKELAQKAMPYYEEMLKQGLEVD